MPAPRLTSLPRIVDAATELLEAGGPRAVTMQAVATAVGVRAPSLYKHVRDREALLLATAEAAVADATASFADSHTLKDLLRAFRAFAHERPEAFRLIFMIDSPRVIAEASAPILAATSALVGPENALNAARLVTSWATGFLTMELAGAFRLGGSLDEAFEYGLHRVVSSLSA